MENLKIGDSFEVVEILSETLGNCDNGYLKQGGHTLSCNEDEYGDGNILVNGTNTELLHKVKSGEFMYGSPVYFMYESEVKLIGKLTITKLK